MVKVKTLERPPIYEISVEKIFLCIIFGNIFIFGILVTCAILKCLEPLLLLFLAQIILLCYIQQEYRYAKSEDIPSEFYHPKLLPQKEYLVLKRKYDEAYDGKLSLEFFSEIPKEKRDALIKSYQETVDELSPILDPQISLRILCRFKKVFGYVQTPAIYKKEENMESNNDIKDIKDINNDFVLNSDKSHSAQKPYTVTVTDEIDQPSDLPPPPKLEISISSYGSDATLCVHPDTYERTLNMEKTVKKLEILDQLETQFAEIKAENEILKESIEKILESKTVF